MQLIKVLPAVAIVLAVAAEDAIEVEKKEVSKRGILEYGHGYGGGVPVQSVEYINAIPVLKPIAVAQPVPVPLPIHVPEPVPVHVPVEVPIYKTVHIPIEKPVPVEVEKPYPVEVIEKIPVPVPKPYPVPYTIYKTKHHFKEIIKPSWW